MAAVAENLEAHMQTLDMKDEYSRREHEAYKSLARQHRQLAAALHAIAREMTSYRDLPMGRHNEAAMTAPPVVEAFADLVRVEQETVALALQQVEQHQRMLAGVG
jgi:hypothetical protein